MNVTGFKRFLGLLGLLPRAFANTAITTVGAGTLTGAALVGGTITRSGPTAAYTDTTDTAALIAAAMPSPPVIGQSWEVVIRNTVAFLSTLAGGTGVTLSGITTIPPLSVGRFLLTYTASGTFTMLGLGGGRLSDLPATKFTTDGAGTATMAAGWMTGANHVYLENTTDGATTWTTRTATLLFADMPNAQIGQTWILTILNSGNNTTTITGGTGVTVTGTATIATLVTRTFHCTFTSATAVTMQGVDVGTIEAT